MTTTDLLYELAQARQEEYRRQVRQQRRVLEATAGPGLGVDSASMELRDATLMLLTESAAHPYVAALAQQAYDQLLRDGAVDYQLLNTLIGELSGQGVLRSIRRKYSPVAFDAILTPILREIDRQAPVPSRPRPARQDDPLTASVWPPH